MPLKSWPAFLMDHPGAYLVLADVSTQRQGRFELLSTLANALVLQGAYSLVPQNDVIRIGFEREADAVKFAAAVNAPPIHAEGAHRQWVFKADLAELDLILRTLRPKISRAPRSVARRPKKSRSFPS